MYVQYGCGLSAPSGWRNFDASPTLVLQRLPVIGGLVKRKLVRFPNAVEYGDVTKRLPLDTMSCEGVYCSHVLEHLALADLRRALRETFRILKPGGVFRLVVPDLELLARSYVADQHESAAITFVRSTILGKEERSRSLAAFLRDWFGNSSHLWMWDYRGLAAELRSVGFVDIRRAQFGDSSDPRFNEAEDESRWRDSLGIESRRPCYERPAAVRKAV